MLKKAATDLAMGRTIVFPVTQAQEIRRLRISQAGDWGNRKHFMEPGGRSVNIDTD